MSRLKPSFVRNPDTCWDWWRVLGGIWSVTGPGSQYLRGARAMLMLLVALSVALVPRVVSAVDFDGDGIDGGIDVCPNTPVGTVVDAAGRPVADLDDDCNADLFDLAMVQMGFTGSSDGCLGGAETPAAGDMDEDCDIDLADLAFVQGNLTGPLPCAVGEPTKDIRLQHVLRLQPSGSATTCTPPASELEYLERSCLLIEVYALDTSEAQRGISCVFFDVELGGDGCAFGGVPGRVSVSDSFPDLQSGTFEGPGFDMADEVGGCTTVGGVGAGEWVLVATLEVGAPQDACSTTVFLSPADADSSVVNGGVAASVGLGEGVETETFCQGTIYDQSPPGGDGEINISDLNVYLGCVGATAPFPDGCERFDWDCNGVIENTEGSGDRDLFETALGKTGSPKDVCAGGIEVSPCRLNCGGAGHFLGANGAGAGITKTRRNSLEAAQP